MARHRSARPSRHCFAWEACNFSVWLGTTWIGNPVIHWRFSAFLEASGLDLCSLSWCAEAATLITATDHHHGPSQASSLLSTLAPSSSKVKERNTKQG
jgi:hypothetical protein